MPESSLGRGLGMSDTEDEPEDFLEQFNAPVENAFYFLYQAGLHKAPCPICKNTDWLTETRPDPKSSEIDYSAPVFAMKDPRSFWGPAPAIPTLALTCTSCGFLRQHNVAWLSKKGEGGSDD